MKRTVFTTLLVAVLMCVSGYAALFVAPDERTMHAAQRIFYFHVPSWIAMFVAFLIAVVGNIAYLTTRLPKWDWLGVASAEVGVTCCTIGLITGPLWAKPIWGTWWTWDPKLTTTFILWMLYISYLLLRTLVEDVDRRATVSAVFGVLLQCLRRFPLLGQKFFRSASHGSHGSCKPCMCGGAHSDIRHIGLYESTETKNAGSSLSFVLIERQRL